MNVTRFTLGSFSIYVTYKISFLQKFTNIYYMKFVSSTKCNWFEKFKSLVSNIKAKWMLYLSGAWRSPSFLPSIFGQSYEKVLHVDFICISEWYVRNCFSSFSFWNSPRQLKGRYVLWNRKKNYSTYETLKRKKNIERPHSFTHSRFFLSFINIIRFLEYFFPVWQMNLLSIRNFMRRASWAISGVHPLEDSKTRGNIATFASMIILLLNSSSSHKLSK